LAEQADRHALLLSRPLEFRLGSPIDYAPQPPPALDDTLGRLRWATALRWWAWRFDDQGLEADIILVTLYHAPDTPPAACTRSACPARGWHWSSKAQPHSRTTPKPGPDRP
jgi:hypothetical protein